MLLTSANMSLMASEAPFGLSEEVHGKSGMKSDKKTDSSELLKFMDETRKLKKVSVATSNLEWFPMYLRVKYETYLSKPEFSPPDTTRFKPEQNLAALLVDLILWKQTNDLVWNQIWSELNSTVPDEIRREVEYALTRHINYQSGEITRRKIFSQIIEKISTQTDSKTCDAIAYEVGVEVLNKIESEINFQIKFQTQHLLKNDLKTTVKPSYSVSESDKSLETAIDYTLMVNRLGALSMWQSEELHEIIENLSSYLSDKMSRKKISKVLSSVSVMPPKYPLAVHQFKFSSKFLPASGDDCVIL